MGEKNSIPPHLIELRAVPANGEAVTEPLKIWIDPGNASPAEIADLLHALSEVHRAAGGSGLSWSIEGDTTTGTIATTSDAPLVLSGGPQATYAIEEESTAKRKIGGVMDAVEAGRRLRALRVAMGDFTVDHAQALERYDRAMHETQWPIDGTDPNVEGSWAWWAIHLGFAEPTG